MFWLRRNFDSVFLVTQVVVDGVALVLAFLLAIHWFGEIPGAIPGGAAPSLSQLVARHLPLVLASLPATLVSFWFFGLYQWQKSILNVEEYRAAMQGVLLAFLLLSAYLFLFRNFESNLQEWFPGQESEPWFSFVLKLTPPRGSVASWRKSVMLAMFLFAFLLVVVERLVMFRFAGMLHGMGLGNIRVAIWGTGPMAQRVEQKLRLFPFLGFHFVGFLADDPRRAGRRLREQQVLSVEDLPGVLKKHRIGRVIVAMPELEEQKLVRTCESLEQEGVDYMVVPRLYHFFSQRFTLESVDTVPLLRPESRPLRVHSAIAKRCLDLIGSLLLLVMFSPLFLLLSLLLRWHSAGPIFFSQVRVGIHGRTFRMYKFRTMHMASCEDRPAPESDEDPRVISGIGSFLRRSSLDEMPQLWNVLLGQMSLVGPRPEMPFIAETYGPFERRRLEMKPGLTGLWQVSEARRAPIHENLDYDLYYIENQSLFLDLVILLLTLVAVPRSRATF